MRARVPGRTGGAVLSRVAVLVTTLAAGWAFTAGVAYGTYAASDTDPYGYVSQAELIASGALSIDNTLARQMPWPFAEQTFTPPGYTVRGDHTMVPAYPAGLPLLMALFQRALGPTAVYVVVPLLGALTVLLTARLGWVLGGPGVAAGAAALIATSPIFVKQVVQPVSDVAVTAWWMLALALALDGGLIAALGAGLAASMAILTRPNLVHLAAVIAGYMALRALGEPATRTQNARRLAVFTVAVLPGSLAVAWLNARLYGSPLTSGYGQLGDIYAWSNLVPNLRRYPVWLVQGHTPLILLAALAPLLAPGARDRSARAGEAGRDARPEHTRRPHDAGSRTGLLLVWIGAVCAAYLFYAAWDDWGYLRFLLPAVPPLVVLATTALVGLTSRLTLVAASVAGRRLHARGSSDPSHLGQASRDEKAPHQSLSSREARARRGAGRLAAAVIVIWAGWQAGHAADAAFTLRDIERRYVDIGQYIERAMPRQSVFITGVHAGSIRYYSGRQTIRFDELGPGWLDEAVRILAERGYRVFIVLENAEQAPFRERFAADNTLGRLDWPPTVERSEAIEVSIFDPSDRPRFLAGGPVVTGDIRPERPPRVRRLGAGDATSSVPGTPRR
jgi:hypothetical protein